MTRRKNIAFAALMLMGAASLSFAERSHDAALGRNLNTFNSLVKELELNYLFSYL